MHSEPFRFELGGLGCVAINEGAFLRLPARNLLRRTYG